MATLSQENNNYCHQYICRCRRRRCCCYCYFALTASEHTCMAFATSASSCQGPVSSSVTLITRALVVSPALAFLPQLDSLGLQMSWLQLSLFQEAHCWIFASSSFLDIWPLLFTNGQRDFLLGCSLGINLPSLRSWPELLPDSFSLSTTPLQLLTSSVGGEACQTTRFCNVCSVSFVWFLNFSCKFYRIDVSRVQASSCSLMSASLLKSAWNTGSP